MSRQDRWHKIGGQANSHANEKSIPATREVFDIHSMNISIRRGKPTDAETIAAYNAALAAETEHLELDRDRLLLGVQAVLEDPSKGFYTIAETGGVLVGQIMITFEWSDWRNGTFWWIQSVYVHPEYRRRGIFSRLHRHVTDEAKQFGTVCGLRLYVEKANKQAQRTYQRLGMQQAIFDMYEVDFVLRR